VNEGVDLARLPELRYTRVWDLVEHLRELRRAFPQEQILMAKADLAQAYRQASTRLSDVWMCCYYFDGWFWTDLRQPFGMSPCPNNFSRLSAAVEWIMRRKGHFVKVYLDDFGLMGVGTRCAEAMAVLLDLFAQLGLPVQRDKLEREGVPATTMVFLGVVIDSDKMELRLEEARIAAMKSTLSKWCRRKRAKLRSIQSLAGVLNFAAAVIRPGRLYCHEIYRATRVSAGDRGKWITLSDAFRADVRWWLDVGMDWPGVAVIPPFEPLTPEAAQWYTDASQWGYGAYFQGEFFYGEWSDEERSLSINLRELLAVYFALAVFGPRVAHSHIWARCDNEMAVFVIGKLSAREPLLVHILRKLHAVQARHDVTLSPHHINGVDNVLADPLSRNRLDIFFSLLPVDTRDTVVGVQVPDAIRRWRE
jgi:hypothetical protein